MCLPFAGSSLQVGSSVSRHSPGDKKGGEIPEKSNLYTHSGNPFLRIIRTCLSLVRRRWVWELGNDILRMRLGHWCRMYDYLYMLLQLDRWSRRHGLPGQQVRPHKTGFLDFYEKHLPEMISRFPHGKKSPTHNNRTKVPRYYSFPSPRV